MLLKWCQKPWLYVMYVLGAVLCVVAALNWNHWPFEMKMVAVNAIILPAHVFEEWQFPGGFSYQYNMVMGSDRLDRYPMNRLTDMITNFGGEILFMTMLIPGIANTGTTLALTVFGWLEVIIHTAIGVFMWAKFKARGKRSIYGPGSATSYIGFLPAAIWGTQWLLQQTITGVDIRNAAILLAIMLVGLILVPENLFKRKENPYVFESAGYYERFLK